MEVASREKQLERHGSVVPALSTMGASAAGALPPLDSTLPYALITLVARLGDTKDLGIIPYLKFTLMGSDLRGAPSCMGAPLVCARRVRPVKSQKSSLRHKSKSSMRIGKPVVRFEPTYRMEPKKPFHWTLVYPALKTALEEGLKGVVYTPQAGVDASKILSAYILHTVKQMDFLPRYKIATLVFVWERQHQGVHCEMRPLWHSEWDGYCSAYYSSPYLVAHAVVFAAFWE